MKKEKKVQPSSVSPAIAKQVLGDVKCDICGNPLVGKSYPVVDENHKGQKGLKQCSKCFGDNIA